MWLLCDLCENKEFCWMGKSLTGLMLMQAFSRGSLFGPLLFLVRVISSKNGGNLKKKEKVHFYLSNNILKFYQNPKGVTPLFWALNHYIWSPNIKNLNLVNSITLYTILLTLNKKYYYNFLWKSIFSELQGVKIYTYQRVKVFKKTSEISWKFGKYHIFHFFP